MKTIKINTVSLRGTKCRSNLKERLLRPSTGSGLALSKRKRVEGLRSLRSLAMTPLTAFLFLSLLFFSQAQAQTPPNTTPPKPMPLVSRGLPAFASSGTASYANDNSFSSYWSAPVPAWLAYDLSSLPVNHRGNVVLAWFNDQTNRQYVVNYWSSDSQRLPDTYAIEANIASGGGNPPSSGWVSLATVAGNRYHSRQHALNLTGYNWIRMNVSSVYDTYGSVNVNLMSLDLHNAEQGVEDNWIFFGDSITANAMHHQSTNVGNIGNFSELVNSQNRNYYPAYENGAIGGTKASDAVSRIDTWLADFPGKYVTLNYGTNEAWGANPGDPNIASTFYNNMSTMAQAIINSGKVPVIPKIPYANTADQRLVVNIPALNQEIDKLYFNFPQVIKGPDLYSFFQQHTNYISGDGVHPSEEGNGAYRQEWADTMMANVYNDTSVSPVASILPGTESDWELTFADEFSGFSLDRGKWNTRYQWGEIIQHNERQAYTDNALEVQNGILRITGDRATAAYDNTRMDYVSGLITSAGKFAQKYGYWEMRAKMPKGQGFWPAFWMTLEKMTRVDEIDIFEILGYDPRTAYMTLHYGNDYTGDYKHNGGSFIGPDFSQDYHIFGLEWEPGLLVWYVDGVERYRTTQSVPQAPMVAQANLAIGGSWPGDPNASTIFPSYLDIDFIRVYRHQDGAAASPVFLPSNRNFTQDIDVTIFTPTAGAVIRYTLDGADPTANSPVYSDLIHLNSTTTLKARAFALGLNDSPIYTATFNIYNNTVALASPWQEADIAGSGVSLIAGLTRLSGNTYLASGAGFTIGEEILKDIDTSIAQADNFHYFYRQLASDQNAVEMVVRVDSLDSTNARAGTGIMLRSDLTCASNYVLLEQTQGLGTFFQYRAGGQTTQIAKLPDTTAPIWLRLAFQNGMSTAEGVFAYVKKDGESDWTLAGQVPYRIVVTYPYLGIATNSGYKDSLATAVLNYVQYPGDPAASLRGDVNNDTQVNVLDIQACVNHILGIQDLGSRGDVNGDGSVDVLDVQGIVNIILGA